LAIIGMFPPSWTDPAKLDEVVSESGLATSNICFKNPF
jgi:hypothetical protein